MAIYNSLSAKRILFSPMVSTNLGTDNLVNVKRSTVKELNGNTVTKLQYDNFWGLLDVEASTEIDWRINQLSLHITPTYILPFNETLYDRHNQTSKGLFYISGGFTFYLFKK